ncbi:hypothetical protein MHYP_G00003070 [Metynnis hypsauchen]
MGCSTGFVPAGFVPAIKPECQADYFPTTSLQVCSVFEAVSELRALSISGRCQGAQLWSAPLRGNHHTLSPCLISLTSISWLSEGSRSLHQRASRFNVGLPGRERPRPAEPQARSAQSHQKVFGR